MHLDLDHQAGATESESESQRDSCHLPFLLYFIKKGVYVRARNIYIAAIGHMHLSKLQFGSNYIYAGFINKT